MGLLVVPAGAQAFTVFTEGFEVDKPVPDLISSSLAGSEQWIRACTGPVSHTGLCGARIQPQNPIQNNSDTVFTQSGAIAGRGAGNQNQLSFWFNINTEGFWDALFVETSIDGGPWADYATRTGAGFASGTAPTITSWGPLGWSGNSSGWRQAVLNLGNNVAKGSSIRFRFRFRTDGSVQSTFVRIDDILETANDGVATPPTAPTPTPVGK